MKLGIAGGEPIVSEHAKFKPGIPIKGGLVYFPLSLAMWVIIIYVVHACQ